MGQSQPLGLGEPGHMYCVLCRAVAPAYFPGILVCRVLRVVDHQIGIGKQLSVTCILSDYFAFARCELPRVRLVIAGINDDGSASRR